MGGKKGGIPDRWLNYTSFGLQIPKTRFIALKVPLHKDYCRSLHEDAVFTPATLMAQIPNLKALIDLTNTNRYYNPQVFHDAKILYSKIYCMGKVIPDSDVVGRFYKAVDQALEYCDTADSCIGVHCTHGLNRTGYLICKYMIERLRIPPTEAIELFQQSRGYTMERENYVADIRNTPWLLSKKQSEVERAKHSRELPVSEIQERNRSNYFDTLNANIAANVSTTKFTNETRQVENWRDRTRNQQDNSQRNFGSTRRHGPGEGHDSMGGYGRRAEPYSREAHNGYNHQDYQSQSSYQRNMRQQRGYFPGQERQQIDRQPSTRGDVLYDPSYDEAPSRYTAHSGASFSGQQRSKTQSSFNSRHRDTESRNEPMRRGEFGTESPLRNSSKKKKRKSVERQTGEEVVIEKHSKHRIDSTRNEPSSKISSKSRRRKSVELSSHKEDVVENNSKHEVGGSKTEASSESGSKSKNRKSIDLSSPKDDVVENNSKYVVSGSGTSSKSSSKSKKKISVELGLQRENVIENNHRHELSYSRTESHSRDNFSAEPASGSKTRNSKLPLERCTKEKVLMETNDPYLAESNDGDIQTNKKKKKKKRNSPIVQTINDLSL